MPFNMALTSYERFFGLLCEYLYVVLDSISCVEHYPNMSVERSSYSCGCRYSFVERPYSGVGIF